MKRNSPAADALRAWREDYVRRTLLGAAASAGCTALFAAYNGYLGLLHRSAWHGSIGVFYLLLTAVRGIALLAEKRNRTLPPEQQDRCRSSAFLLSAGLLLALDLALILPISMMVVLDKPVSMGRIPAIAMAAYTTWKITMASLHLGRQRRRPCGNTLAGELRTVNFIDALVAVLTLQNTLIMVMGTGEENGMLSLSAVSSGIIYAAIVAITLRMLKKGLQQRKA